MDIIQGLICRECGRGQPASPVHVCDQCFGPLEVAYSHAALKGAVSREAIAAGPPSMWRYRALLPLTAEPAVGHAVGFTPLVRARNLAAALGVAEVFVKNDSVCHPTWSFKDRVVAVAVSKALEFGFDTLACASTGNLANSVAAHAAEAGLRAVVLVPGDLEQGKALPTLVYGPAVIEVDGTYDDVNRLCAEIADRRPWAFVNVNLKPYYAEGSKTVGYEIVEQLGWRFPGHMVVPCAGGSLMTKVWQAMKDLAALGLADDVLTTRVHAAQPLGCGPIVTMIKDDTDVVRPVRPRTVARSLAIGDPADGRAAYLAAKESGGSGEHASDEEIVDGMRLLARSEGIFAETAGGVTVAAARRLVQRGIISRDDSLVLVITGSGLKTPDALADRLTPLARIRPSLAAFDEAVRHLSPHTAQEER